MRITSSSRVVIAAGISFITVRAVITILGTVFADSPVWYAMQSDGIEHYQLGILLIIFSIVVRRFLRTNQECGTDILLGAGFGLVIDETNQLLSYIGISYYSLGLRDVAFALISYCIFVMVLLRKNHTAIETKRTCEMTHYGK